MSENHLDKEWDDYYKKPYPYQPPTKQKISYIT